MAQALSMLSQSSIQDYEDCPRRFKLKYVDLLRYPAIESEPVLENERRQMEGMSFHRLVQQYYLGLDQETLRRLAESHDLERWWTNFLNHMPALDECTVLTEYTLSGQIAGVKLVAKYDLIAIQGKQVTIYDWKTSAKRPGAEAMAARWQTRVYLALLTHAGGFLAGAEALEPGSVRMVYWFPEFPTEPILFAYDEERFQRDWNALKDLAEEIPLVEEFPQTDDLSVCRFCTYRSYCDRGSSAPQGSERDAGEGMVIIDLDFEQIGEIAF